jgi:mediator of RNA polymerase II transcription subunit 31
MTTASPPPSSGLSPPRPPSPRFTLELEFVLSLSNPYYLSHLALTYPHLLNPPQDLNQSISYHSSPSASEPESDASKFASYLSYLYNYWRQPEYARFLTHPGATLRNLELLQQEQFRKGIIRPDVIEKLLAAGSGSSNDESAKPHGEDARHSQGNKEAEVGVKEEKAEDGQRTATAMEITSAG